MMRFLLPTILLFSSVLLASGEEKVETVPQSVWPTGGTKPKPDRMKKHTDGITSIVIHHTETPNQLPSSEVSRLINVQRYHIEDRGWGDIAYHYLIGPSGKIYEGRDWHYQGDSGTKYDLNGRLLVCMIGSFTDRLPEKEALISLIEFVAAKMQEHDVDSENLVTHRMVASTDCPGDMLQQWFEASGKDSIQKRYEGIKRHLAYYHTQDGIPDPTGGLYVRNENESPQAETLVVPEHFTSRPSMAVAPPLAETDDVLIDRRFRSPDRDCEFAVTVVRVGDLGTGEYDRLISWRPMQKGEIETSTESIEKEDKIIQRFGITSRNGHYTRYFQRSYSLSKDEDALAVLWEFMIYGPEAHEKWKQAYAEFKASLDLSKL